MFSTSTDAMNGLKDVTKSDPQGAAEETHEQVNWLLARSRSGKEKSHHYLLLLRFALVNILGMGLLAAVYVQGWIDTILAGDKSYLSLVIFSVFCGGLLFCGWRVWQTSRDLNQVKSFDPLTTSATAEYVAKIRGRGGDSRSILAGSLRLRLSHRISVVRHAASSLVLLGLIGTVIGFIIALSGVDPERASDIKSIAPMVSTMIEGLSTALYTTLVGAVLNVWLMINYRLLAGGTVKLVNAMIEFGEEHART